MSINNSPLADSPFHRIAEEKFPAVAANYYAQHLIDIDCKVPQGLKGSDLHRVAVRIYTYMFLKFLGERHCFADERNPQICVIGRSFPPQEGASSSSIINPHDSEIHTGIIRISDTGTFAINLGPAAGAILETRKGEKVILGNSGNQLRIYPLPLVTKIQAPYENLTEIPIEMIPESFHLNDLSYTNYKTKLSEMLIQVFSRSFEHVEKLEFAFLPTSALLKETLKQRVREVFESTAAYCRSLPDVNRAHNCTQIGGVMQLTSMTHVINTFKNAYKEELLGKYISTPDNQCSAKEIQVRIAAKIYTYNLLMMLKSTNISVFGRCGYMPTLDSAFKGGISRIHLGIIEIPKLGPYFIDLGSLSGAEAETNDGEKIQLFFSKNEVRLYPLVWTARVRLNLDDLQFPNVEFDQFPEYFRNQQEIDYTDYKTGLQNFFNKVNRQNIKYINSLANPSNKNKLLVGAETVHNATMEYTLNALPELSPHRELPNPFIHEANGPALNPAAASSSQAYQPGTSTETEITNQMSTLSLMHTGARNRPRDLAQIVEQNQNKKQRTSVDFSVSRQLEATSQLTAALLENRFDDAITIITENKNHISANGIIPFENNEVTLLSFAILHRRGDVAMLMLENDPEANVNAMTATGATPLRLAAGRLMWDTVLLMLKTHPTADVNVSPSVQYHGHGRTPLWYACAKKRWDVVIEMINICPSPDINTQSLEGSYSGATPLWFAAFWKEWNVVNLMIKNHPNPNINAAPTSGPYQGKSVLANAPSFIKNQILSKIEMKKAQIAGSRSSTNELPQFEATLQDSGSHASSSSPVFPYGNHPEDEIQ